MSVTNHVLARRRTLVQLCMHLGFYIFLAVGLFAVGYAGYIIADAKAYQAIQLPQFAHDVPVVEPHFPRIGEAIGEIEIPRLALKAVILQGDSSQVLRRGVGHLAGTPMPGEWGNVGLAGHRDSFFRPLRQIRPGDIIRVRSRTGTFGYRVDSTSVVSPRDVSVVKSSERSELTLVTCFPFDYIGSAPNRFVVRASEISQFVTTASTDGTEPDEILRIAENWIQSYNAGSASRVAQLYTDDGYYVSAHVLAHGREAIRTYWERGIKAGT